jgi:hypothetical protein
MALSAGAGRHCAFGLEVGYQQVVCGGSYYKMYLLCEESFGREGKSFEFWAW